jgi:hypothetical protein
MPGSARAANTPAELDRNGRRAARGLRSRAKRFHWPKMKVLFHHLTPFAFVPGGLQTQITQTREALLRTGVEVEFFRWYDGKQTGDVLHFFGQIPTNLLNLARNKRIKVVLSDPLGGLVERSTSQLWLRRTVIRSLKKTLPRSRISMFDWEGYELADACIALSSREAHLMSYLFDASPQKVHVMPNGVEETARQLKSIYERVLNNR